LGDFNSAVLFSQSISISPNGILELRRLDNDLRKNYTAVCLNGLDADMDASTEAKHHTGILSIQHEVAAG